MSLRTRVALATALVTGLVLAAVGVALVDRVADEARADLDAQLEEDFEDASSRATARVVLQNLRDPSIDPATSTVAVFFTGRVFAQGALLAQSEDVPDLRTDPPQEGFATIDDREGRAWRVLTRQTDILVESLADEGPLTIQVMVPTAETDQTIDEVRSTALRLGLGGMVVVAAAAWALSWAALRPLRRLAQEASLVSTTADLERRVPESGPVETRAVARSLNAMLQRLGLASQEREDALETARSFAADVGHEVRGPLTSMQADLDVLAGNPDLAPAERAGVVEDLAGQHGRIVRVFDELRQLARGDLEGERPSDVVDLAATVETCVDAARHHHPEVDFVMEIGTDPTEVLGSEEGLRVLVANLLDNAAVHGHPTAGAGSPVRVRLASSDGAVVLRVEDDGPGPPSDLADPFERFERGAEAAGEGSGLGLAIVRQQAERHGGAVTLERAGPAGGARATLRLPAAEG